MKLQAACLLLLPLAATAFVPPAAAPATTKGRSSQMAAEGMSRKDALKAASAGELLACPANRFRADIAAAAASS